MLVVARESAWSGAGPCGSAERPFGQQQGAAETSPLAGSHRSRSSWSGFFFFFCLASLALAAASAVVSASAAAVVAAAAPHGTFSPVFVVSVLEVVAAVVVAATGLRRARSLATSIANDALASVTLSKEGLSGSEKGAPDGSIAKSEGE